MRVLMVSTSYPRDETDWRGIFIRHLVSAFSRTSGIELALWAPPGEIPDGVDTATTSGESAWLAQLMAAGGVSHLMRSGGFTGMFAPLQLLRLLRAA